MKHEDLVALGADLNLSPAWREMAARATAEGDRRILLGPLARHLLVANEHGRARLRRWLDAQHGVAPTALPGWLLREWIAERVVFCGDGALLPLVVQALALVPTSVREAAVAEVAFLAVGVDSAAWTGGSTFAGRDGIRKPRVVVLGPTASLHIALHELAHVWHSPAPREGAQLVTAQGERGFYALAARQGWLPRLDDLRARSERLADATAAAWLASHFPLPLTRR